MSLSDDNVPDLEGLANDLILIASNSQDEEDVEVALYDYFSEISTENILTDLESLKELIKHQESSTLQFLAPILKEFEQVFQSESYGEDNLNDEPLAEIAELLRTT